MLGVRFLDVDFMRENLACASPTVYVTRVFCTVVKSGCMERIAIAMQDGGTGAGAQHGGAGREANLIFVLRPNLYNRTPGRGDSWSRRDALHGAHRDRNAGWRRRGGGSRREAD